MKLFLVVLFPAVQVYFLTILGLLPTLDHLLSLVTLLFERIWEILPDLDSLVKFVDDQISRHDRDDSCFVVWVTGLHYCNSKLPLLHVLRVPVRKSKSSRKTYCVDIDKFTLRVVFNVEFQFHVVLLTHEEVIIFRFYLFPRQVEDIILRLIDYHVLRIDHHLDSYPYINQPFSEVKILVVILQLRVKLFDDFNLHLANLKLVTVLIHIALELVVGFVPHEVVRNDSGLILPHIILVLFDRRIESAHHSGEFAVLNGVVNRELDLTLVVSRHVKLDDVLRHRRGYFMEQF